MATKQRVSRLEQARRRRAATVGQRIVTQLSDSELARLAAGFERFTDSELERIAAGTYAPQVESAPLDPALLARLSALCDNDAERRLLNL